ncbi:MAG: DUF3604 domain-containing protein [Chitinophagales bacterium]|nr:DUF3604 domain-containing protein [Chitinophagales bacterium]
MVNGYTNAFTLSSNTSTVSVNTTTAKHLSIKNDSTDIYPNTQIKIIFPKLYSDFAYDGMNLFPFIFIPANIRAGYLKATINNKAQQITSVNLLRAEFTNQNLQSYNIEHDDKGSIVTIKLLDTLKTGTSLEIIYGANGNGTFTGNRGYAYEDQYRVLCNFNTNNYLLNTTAQSFKVLPDSNNLILNVVLPSIAKKNEPAILKLMITDRFTNIVNVNNKTIGINVPNNVNCTNTIQINNSNHIDVPITFLENGIYQVECILNGKIYKSNFTLVDDKLSNIYWGDFHSHTKYSRDGLGDNSLSYARNSDGLDFSAVTDHSDGNHPDTFGVNYFEWSYQLNQAVQFHQPNRFIPFVGFENSLAFPSNHHNAIFNFNDNNLFSIPRWGRSNCPTIQSMYQQADLLPNDIQTLIIPHHTGKCFSCVANSCTVPMGFSGTYGNAKYRRLAEVYSVHGLSEYYDDNHPLSYTNNSGNINFCGIKGSFIQDGWTKGERLGLIASGDNHVGQTTFRTQGGGAAVIADTLTRDALFQALYNRHTYATTGERIILNFIINDSLMGSEMILNTDTLPKLDILCIGSDELDYLDVVKWNFTSGIYSNDIPQFEVIKRIYPKQIPNVIQYTMIDAAFTENCMYYIRAKQKNKVNNTEVWAWSSPIWIDKNFTTTHTTLDSIFNFNAITIQNGNLVSWSVLNEAGIDYYIVEKSTDSINFISLDTIVTTRTVFLDTTYHYIDNATTNCTYYRLKIVNYNNQISYTNIIKLCDDTEDSIFQFSVNELSDRINLQWNAKQETATSYNIYRSKIHENLVLLDDVSRVGMTYQNYNYDDFLPIKDSSIYQVVMSLPNGSFKISNTDTLYFIMDSVVDFHAMLSNDSVYLVWKNIHEHETSSFELEKKTHSNDLFELMLEFVPQFGLFDTLNYVIVDDMPNFGWNYYQLTQNKFNEKYRVVGMDSVFITNTATIKNISKNITFRAIENLVAEGRNQLFIETNTTKNLNGQIRIIDISGRTQYEQAITIKSQDKYISLPIANLGTGVYYVIYSDDDVLLKTSFLVMLGH